MEGRRKRSGVRGFLLGPTRGQLGPRFRGGQLGGAARTVRTEVERMEIKELAMEPFEVLEIDDGMVEIAQPCGNEGQVSAIWIHPYQVEVLVRCLLEVRDQIQAAQVQKR